MRKCLVLLLLLSLLSVGGLVYAHGAVDDLSDKVSFTEVTHSGELSAAEGLVVNVNTQMESNLFWETEYPLGGAPKTDFAFYQSDQHGPYRYRSYGLSIDFPSGYGWSSSRGVNYEDPSEEDLGRMDSDYALLPILQAVSRNTPPNSDHTEVVRVADYFEYLPLNFDLDDENVFWVVEEDGYANVYRAERLGWEFEGKRDTALQDYFRIPVPEEMMLEITMHKNGDGLINDLNINSAYEKAEGWSEPQFEIHNALTEAGCYFTFQAKCRDLQTWEERALDTGHIEGGYGVYLLPYTTVHPLVEETQEDVRYVAPEQLRCVYSFEDESVVPQEIHVLEEENQLLLTTLEEGVMYLNVIDLAGGELVQKLPLLEQDGEEGWDLRHVWYEDDFLVHLNYNNRFTLCQRTETGYEVRIEGVMSMDESMDHSLYADQIAMAYNREKLGVAFSIYRTEPYYDCASSIGVMVYDPTGLLYSGVHVSSLDIGSDQYSRRVTLTEEGIALRWE